MDLANLIEKTFEGGNIDVKNLHSIIKLISNKLLIEDINQVEQSAESVRVDNLKENFDVINLTKRVEAVENVTKQILSSLEKIEQIYSCLSGKLEETRIFVNKLHEKIQKINRTPATNGENIPNDVITSCCLPFDAEELNLKLDQNSKDIETLKFSQAILDGRLDQTNSSYCTMTKEIHKLKENVEDLTFAVEFNEGKTEEIEKDVKQFNARICDIKCDFQKITQNSKCLGDKISKLNKKIDILDDQKADLSHLDESLKQKAFKSDIEFLVRNDVFDSLYDTLQLRTLLLSDQLEKIKINSDISLARLQNQINGKLNSDEILKFNKSLEKNFNNFCKELEVIIKEIISNGLDGAGGKCIDLNCISCDANIVMKTETSEVPKLKPLSQRFLMRTNKNLSSKNQKHFSTIDDVLNLCRSSKMNESNQKCFIISKDNSIFKADPKRCYNNSRNNANNF